MIDTISLKTSLIDLAVSGRLSTDFQAEDSVSEIIEKLPAPSNKRKKLLGQTFEYGKQVDIPDNWRWMLLGEISSYGDTPVKANTSNVIDNTWILDLEDIKAGGELLTKTRANEKQFAGEKTIFRSGQVLYSKLRPYLKKVLVADEDGISTPELISFDVFGGILPQYMVYCLLDTFTNRAINKRSYGIKMPRIDAGFMVNLPVPIPPVSEQQYIIERLERTFALIDTVDNLQGEYASNQEALKSKLIDAAIQGKLTEQLSKDGTAEELFEAIRKEKAKLVKEGKIKNDKLLPDITDEEIPFEIPGNWKWVHVRDVGITVTGNTPSKSHQEYYGGEYPFYKPADLDAGRHITEASEYLTESGWAVSRQLNKGTILVCCIGSIGKCAIIDNDGTANQQINALSPIMCDSDYLMLAIERDSFKRQLDQWSRATTVSIINKSKFDSCIVPLPPLGEQKRIVDRVNKLLRSIVD